MELNVQLAEKLLAYPYALFKNKNCILESKIDDSYLLKALFENATNSIETQSVNLKSFRGFLLISNYTKIKENNYTLITILKEEHTKNWSTTQWDTLTKTLNAFLHILTMDLNSPFSSKDLDTLSESKSKPTLHAKQFNHDFQNQYQLEINLLSLLRKKNLHSVKPLLKKIVSFNTVPLSKDPLLNKKYKLIAFITLLTRASIKQGVAANIAYRLSDSLIQELDHIEASSEITDFTTSILIEFSNLYKGYSNHFASNTVNDAINYIHTNLYDELTNSDISAYVSVHPAYLSSLFKKTTGISLHTYIINEKIAEAQYLLTNTDFTCSIISELLHFSNQSHFCKLFKQHTHYTPKEFRLWF